MAARKTRARSANATRGATSTTTAEAPTFEIFSAFTDLPRRQMALASYSTTALLRGSQELRRIQLETAQRAFQETVRYWQQLADAAFRLQADMVSSASEAVAEGASEPTFETFRRAFEATMNGAAVPGTAH